MKKLIFLMITLFFSTAISTANAEIATSIKSTELVQLFNRDLNKSADRKIKKKKIKKVVRKVGRVYRKVKDDRNSKKKSRRIQRTAQIIISIF